MSKPITRALAITAAAATISAVSPSAAGPLPVSTADVTLAAPSDIVNVRNRGGAIVAGVALGLIGAAIAASNPYYYGPAYYPPYAYYYPPYAPPYYHPYYPSYGSYWAYAPRVYRVYPRPRYLGHPRHHRYRR